MVGKTYTIQGAAEPEHEGLLPRTLDSIFNYITERTSRYYTSVNIKQQSEDRLKETTASPVSNTNADKKEEEYTFTVYVSSLEIYNECVYDLLGDVTDSQPRYHLSVFMFFNFYFLFSSL